MKVSNHWTIFRRRNAQKAQSFQVLEKWMGSGFARFVWLGLLCILLVILYFPVCSPCSELNGFAWIDDQYMFWNNPHLLVAWNVNGLRQLMSHPYFLDWTPFYWPLIWVERGLFGNTAVTYRLFSIGFYMLSMAIMGQWLYRLVRNVAIVGFTVLLIGLHPIMIESVEWVTSQKTVLSLLLAVCALNIYDLSLRRESGILRGVCAVVVFLALGMKLRGLALPFGLCLYDVCFYWAKAGRFRGAMVLGALKRCWLMLMLSLGWAAYNQLVVFRQVEGGSGVSSYLGGGFFASIATHAVIEMRTLLGHWLIPNHLYFYYDFTLYDWSDWMPWLSVFVLLGTVGLILLALPLSMRPWGVFAVGWIGLQRALPAGIFPMQWCVMNNRYSTVAILGAAVLLLLLFHRCSQLPWWQLTQLVRWLAGFTVVVLFLVWGRNSIGLLENREAKREATQPGCVMHDWVDYQMSKRREDKVVALRNMVSRRAVLSPFKMMKVVDAWLLLLWKDSPDEDFQICRELIDTNAGSDWERLLYHARLTLAAGDRQMAVRGFREAVDCAPQMMTDWVESADLSSETVYLDFVSTGDGVMRYFFLKKWAAATRDFLPIVPVGTAQEWLEVVDCAWDQKRKIQKEQRDE